MNFNKLTHPIFVICLGLLLLNDFYLKSTFSNYLTGKLSDFTGLFVFAVFFSQIIPSSKKWISLITGLLFIVWKTPLVTPLIEMVNEFGLFKIQRIVDYSDYIALLVLPIAHHFIKRDLNLSLNINFSFLKFSQYVILSLSVFSICATSTRRVKQIPEGTVYIGKSYTIKSTKEETLSKIQSLGYKTDYHESKLTDSLYYDPFYQTNNIILQNKDEQFNDTIVNVKFRFYSTYNKSKTKLELINVCLNTDEPIQQIKILRRLKNEYKDVLKELIVDELE